MTDPVVNTTSDAAYADQLMTYLHEVCGAIDPKMFDEPHASVELVAWAKESLAEERAKAAAALREAKLDAERAKAERNALACRLTRPVNEVEWKAAMAACGPHHPWWLVASYLVQHRRNEKP